jgi:hypothetical protein
MISYLYPHRDINQPDSARGTLVRYLGTVWRWCGALRQSCCGVRKAKLGFLPRFQKTLPRAGKGKNAARHEV